MHALGSYHIHSCQTWMKACLIKLKLKTEVRAGLCHAASEVCKGTQLIPEQRAEVSHYYLEKVMASPQTWLRKQM